VHNEHERHAGDDREYHESNSLRMSRDGHAGCNRSLSSPAGLRYVTRHICSVLSLAVFVKPANLNGCGRPSQRMRRGE
jgi:hypothetical protein